VSERIKCWLAVAVSNGLTCAAMSMARFWRDQGKRPESFSVQSTAGFTERVDTLDLKEGRALLAAPAQGDDVAGKSGDNCVARKAHHDGN
jgi:hypothetical protein